MKKLRCYLGLHRWQKLRKSQGGGWYEECRDCGKYRDIEEVHVIDPGPGGGGI